MLNLSIARPASGRERDTAAPQPYLASQKDWGVRSGLRKPRILVQIPMLYMGVKIFKATDFAR